MVKIKRGENVISVNVEDIRIGDQFMVVTIDGLLTCTGTPMYDDDDDCYYVSSGFHMFHEAMIVDVA